VSDVAPVRLVPLNVNGKALLPWSALVGLTAVRVGPCTVKAAARMADPEAPVETVTLWAPRVAPVEMVKVAVTIPEFTTWTLVTLTPPPTVTPAPPVPESAPVRLVPVSVTLTAEPRTPVAGLIPVNVGAPREMTVKATALLVPPPPGTVTVTFLAPRVAPVLIVKVALTWVSFCTAIPLTVTPPPPPPDTLIAVVPVSPLPKRLTANVVPRTPWFGEIDWSTGPVTEKVTVPLVPPGVVTKICRGPTTVVDEPEMLTVAVMQGKGTPAPHVVAELTTVPAVMLTPFVGVAT
jgi:hypothetical protein